MASNFSQTGFPDFGDLRQVFDDLWLWQEISIRENACKKKLKLKSENHFSNIKEAFLVKLKMSFWVAPNTEKLKK